MGRILCVTTRPAILKAPAAIQRSLPESCQSSMKRRISGNQMKAASSL